jgi:hypothetical protein
VSADGDGSGGEFEQRSELASNLSAMLHRYRRDRPELATAMTNGNGNVAKGTKTGSSWGDFSKKILFVIILSHSFVMLFRNA